MIRNSLKRKELRRESAKELAASRASITDQQQLDKLNLMFGEGKGAAKERAKLAKRMEEAAQKEAVKEEKVAKATKKIKQAKRNN